MHFSHDLHIYRNIYISDKSRKSIYRIIGNEWICENLEKSDNGILFKFACKIEFLYKAYVLNNIIKLSETENDIITDVIDILLYHIGDKDYKIEVNILKKITYKSLYNCYKNYNDT